MAIAFTVMSTNILAHVFAAQFEWDENWMQLNQYLLQILTIVAKIAASLVGGKSIQKGRKGAFIKYNLYGLFAILLIWSENYFALCVGTPLHSFSIIVVQISICKMVNESIPVYKLGQLGVFT